MDILRARRERTALSIDEPDPPDSIDDIWSSATQIATIGTFVLLLVAGLYFCRPILLPVLAALLIGTTLAPLVKAAMRYGISPWLTSVALVGTLVIAIGEAATLLAGPISAWIDRTPDIGVAIEEKLHVLESPLAALRQLYNALAPAGATVVSLAPSQLAIVTPVLAFITPAAVQLVLFVVALFFYLPAQIRFRQYLATFLESRGAKLRLIRIVNDLERNLASYLAIVTAINAALGIVVAAGTWLYGFPNPFILGVLAMVLNYIPYVGPGCMALILLGVGLVSFPSLGAALAPPAAFVALATIEGNILTPTILGRELTLNPFAVLLSIAFWAWLWGPVGAFLAVPLSIVALVTIGHLFPSEASKLPG